MKQYCFQKCQLFSPDQRVEDTSHQDDVSTLNLVAPGESKKDQTMFCENYGATATTTVWAPMGPACLQIQESD